MSWKDTCKLCQELNKSNISIKTFNPKKFIKVVSNAKGWGGASRSITTIMKLLLKEGHKVEFIPFLNQIGSREFNDCIKNELDGLIVTYDYSTMREKCDVLFVYANDYVWEFTKPEVADIFSGVNAEKKIMMLNYRNGSVGKTEWTKGWSKYMFLNSTHEKELLKLIPSAKTRVLPPCTLLDDFILENPTFDNGVRIVRHSSQGDTKFSKSYGDEVNSILSSRKDVNISLMPKPSFVEASDRLINVPKTANTKAIAKFLASGNLFVYSLPEGYMDAGPRTVLEAMSVGLPIIADNWGGAKDRVTPETGWLCNSKKEMIDIIKNVTMEELKTKGRAAKQRAIDEFIPANWLKEILE